MNLSNRGKINDMRYLHCPLCKRKTAHTKWAGNRYRCVSKDCGYVVDITDISVAFKQKGEL